MQCIDPQTKKKMVKGSEFTYTHRCGQCMPCRINRRQEWTLKMLLEAKLHDYATFVTLTYAPEYYPEDGNLSKEHAQKFLKRFRNHLHRKFDEKFRYFLVGEYGEKTKRAHYHAIIFGPSTEVTEKCLEHSWKLGFTTFSELNASRARYAARYTTKKLTSQAQLQDGTVTEFALMSRKPALGHGMLPAVAHSLRRLRNSTSSGLSYVEWEKATINMLPGYLRVDGSIYPMDSIMKRKLADLLSIPEQSDLSKALVHTFTVIWPNLADPMKRCIGQARAENMARNEYQRRGQL